MSKKQEIINGFVDNAISGKRTEDIPKYIHEDVLINSVTGVRGLALRLQKKLLLSGKRLLRSLKPNLYLKLKKVQKLFITGKRKLFI